MLLFRSVRIAAAAHVVNAGLHAFANVASHASPVAALLWRCLVGTISLGRFLLARRFLKENGCQAYHGSLFGEPAPIEELRHML